MSISRKEVTGYRTVLIADVERKVQREMGEIASRHPEYDQEEILFNAYAKVFREARELTSKPYTRGEVRSYILSKYFIDSPAYSEALLEGMNQIIAQYPEFSNVPSTKKPDCYSVVIAGKNYCPESGTSHCEIVDKCKKVAMKMSANTIEEMIKNLPDEEIDEIFNTAKVFVKHEEKRRHMLEACENDRGAVKSYVAFSSANTLMGYSLRYSMPFVIYALSKKRNEKKMNPSVNPAEAD